MIWANKWEGKCVKNCSHSYDSDIWYSMVATMETLKLKENKGKLEQISKSVVDGDKGLFNQQLLRNEE